MSYQKYRMKPIPLNNYVSDHLVSAEVLVWYPYFGVKTASEPCWKPSRQTTDGGAVADRAFEISNSTSEVETRNINSARELITIKNTWPVTIFLPGLAQVLGEFWYNERRNRSHLRPAIGQTRHKRSGSSCDPTTTTIRCWFARSFVRPTTTTHLPWTAFLRTHPNNTPGCTQPLTAIEVAPGGARVAGKRDGPCGVEKWVWGAHPRPTPRWEA